MQSIPSRFTIGNYFSAPGAKLLTFEVGIVLSPPLVFERKKVTMEGKELEDLDIPQRLGTNPRSKKMVKTLDLGKCLF